MKTFAVGICAAVVATYLAAGPLQAATKVTDRNIPNANAQSASVYVDLHDFGGTGTLANGGNGPDGSDPDSGVTFDSAGNMCGTTFSGSSVITSTGYTYSGAGMVWQINTSGVYNDLHDFGGPVINADGVSGEDGSKALAGVTFDRLGDMYGITQGGPYNTTDDVGGELWELTASGTYKDLHDFGGTVINADGLSGPDGAVPSADVTLDDAGNIYGTTGVRGANGHGVIWELTLSGSYRDLHDFGGTVTLANGASGQDGIDPGGSVTFDTGGNMYGTAGGTADGGFGGGMVWELTAYGFYKDLHDFGGEVPNGDGTNTLDGAFPIAGVTIDATGNVFGTTALGGLNRGGTVWEISEGGTYRILHSFGGTVTNADGTSGLDGSYVMAGVSFDSAGNMFGEALEGGPNVGAYGGDGMVWEITPSGAYYDQHDFGGTTVYADGTSGPDGLTPYGGVTVNISGDLYGTASAGGANNGGVIFKLTPVVTTPTVVHAFQAGIQMISVPTDYTGESLSSVLGYSSPVLAVWQPSASTYAVTPNAPAGSLVAGQAYWVRFPATATITTAGTAPSTPFTIQLARGWNMIGCPQSTVVPVSSLTVTDASNVSHTFADAASSGIVEDPLFTFQAGDVNYELITAAAGSLTPYYGYWLYASQACTLSFPTGG